MFGDAGDGDDAGGRRYGGKLAENLGRYYGYIAIQDACQIRGQGCGQTHQLPGVQGDGFPNRGAETEGVFQGMKTLQRRQGRVAAGLRNRSIRAW